jgi:hypothetical protein
MSETILPQSETLRQALRWISDERSTHPNQPLRRIIEDAALRFDLSPAQQEWLRATLR